MAAPSIEPGLAPAGGARFFCTAGRGLEPFLMREVRARLAATQVEYISGKVFFATCSDLAAMKKLKSAERLFLLVKKQLPLTVSPLSKGKTLSEMQRLVNDDPESWLNAISLWKKLLEHDAEKGELSRRDINSLKRKVGGIETNNTKRLKAEEMQAAEETPGECWLEKLPEGALEPRDSITRNESLQEQKAQNEAEEAGDAPRQDLTFRVSCRCSGTVGKAFAAQEVGRIIGIALMKQFGWKADLRNPNLEVFMHLNDVYCVVGIPLFRVPLASRTYIQTAGLRSTIAWAMASLAEIRAGAFVLDPMCGLGTILLEAAKEWPDVHYVGADVSDSQLRGAYDNLKAAGLEDKVELLKVSVTELPLHSESVDIIISDIPFGKKFKLAKNIRSILQEMERVLRIDGTVVLLLSEDHHRSLGPPRDSGTPKNSRDSQIADPEIRKLSDPDGKEDTSPTAWSSGEATSQECQDSVPLLGSLLPGECFRVSLGRTGAFICKYRKAQAAGPSPGSSPEHCHRNPQDSL